MKRLLLLSLLLAGCAAAPRPSFVPGSQGRIHVSDGGAGSALPIVFVHGNGANLTQWSGQLTHFRRSRRAVAFDLRGMGWSDVPADGDYSIAAMAGDLHTVVNALNLDRFILVGHSYGGPVVAAYAARHPERVAGAVYADAAGDIKATREQSDRYLDALRMDKPRTVRVSFAPMLATATDEVKAAVLWSADRTSTEAFGSAMEGLRDFDVARAVSAYRGPMLAIAALDHPSAFHVQFTSVPVRSMEGAGHWLMMERPAQFNYILQEFADPLR
ncbi:MAG TPA: alpha/beta hydrolase [Thermoanaerobaculia bacterium]|nr:alpha/beta hydrolase [Thermoanaerobaculia bacterium]